MVVSSGAQLLAALPYEEQRLALDGARQPQPPHRLLHRAHRGDLLPRHRARAEEAHPAQPVRATHTPDPQQPQRRRRSPASADAEAACRAAGQRPGDGDDHRREQHVRGEQQQQRGRARPARAGPVGAPPAVAVVERQRGVRPPPASKARSAVRKGRGTAGPHSIHAEGCAR